MPTEIIVRCVSLSMKEAIINVLRNFAAFSGRGNRSESGFFSGTAAPDKSTSEEKRYRSARAILTRNGFDYREMAYNGDYKRFLKYNIPREVEEQWLDEWNKDNYHSFLKLCEQEHPPYSPIVPYLTELFRWINKLDEQKFMTLYRAVMDHTDNFTPDVELACWARFSMFLNNVNIPVSEENLRIVAAGMKTRLDDILEKNPELASEYKYTQGFYDHILPKYL